MRFDELVQPLSQEEFLADYFGKKPLHIPSRDGSPRRDLFGWPRFNELLTVLPHWTEDNLKLIMNSRPINPDFYMDRVETLGGHVRRADPAKLDVFLAMGVSVVANAVEDISSEVRRVADTLGDQFSARVGANAYCSFGGVQAFASHCDLHDVFALHCEGEKDWNIYENRAQAPIEQLTSDNAQQIIDAAKGRVMLRVRMRPGDLLYIPRGYYHDALASSDASLHLTFSVSPLHGRAIFSLLEEEAMNDPIFRQYLPDPRENDGALLDQRLSDLADRVRRIIESEGFRTRLQNRQRELWKRDYMFQLPARKTLEFYARSEKPAAVDTTREGIVLKIGAEELQLGHLGEAAQWIFSRPAFSLQELSANFQYLDEKDLRELVAKLQIQGLFFPYKPISNDYTRSGAASCG
jgi:bifunctional lysine-specific demethylase and histidyl-hydroxylase NO66